MQYRLKYTGCYISKNRTLPLDELVLRARALIELLLDYHEWYNAEWCYAKELDNKQHKVILMNMRQQEEELPAFLSSSSEDDESKLDNHQCGNMRSVVSG